MTNSSLPNPHARQHLVAPSTPTTWDVVRPIGANYNGAPLASDAGTLANVDEKPDYPGSGYPNQTIARGASTSTRGLPNAAPTPGRGGRRPVR